MSGEIAAVSTAAGTVTGALAALMIGTLIVLLYPLLKLRPGQAQRAFLPPRTPCQTCRARAAARRANQVVRTESRGPPASAATKLFARGPRAP